MQSTVCARPDCSGTATAWLTYDYAAQQVWLDDGPGPELGNQWGLCGLHAGRLRAPKGWTEVDRRGGPGAVRAAGVAGLLSAVSGSNGGADPRTPLSRSTAVPNPWGLPEAVVGFAVGLVLAATAASIASGVVGYHTGHGAPLPVAVTVSDVVALWLGLVGAALWASRRRGTSSLARDFGLKVASVWDLVAGAALGLAAQYVLIPLLYLPLEQIDHSLAHQLGGPARQDTGAAHGVVQIVILVVVLVVGAPIVEELFFRGLLLRGLLARIPPAAAIVVTGLLFALAHFEAVQFLGLAAFGVLLGLVAWWTGRLGPSIAAHAAFNAAAVASVARLH